MPHHNPAPRNHTLTLTRDEFIMYGYKILTLESPATLDRVVNKTINMDLLTAVEFLPSNCADLIIIDPPYNLNKSFNGRQFREQSVERYSAWLECWFPKLLRIAKPTASVYICSDWNSSTAIHLLAKRYLTVRNRITWEREKGRGAKSNWKNCSEDIWFCTISNNYTFNVDAVKHKRRVLAPYTDNNGKPKDWKRTNDGSFRLTHPSNLWTDISIPFWSMPENTEHPTQKPEKLIAKLILASSNPGDLVLDPFLGSGTTSVVAKKLGRHYIGIEIDERYCCLSEKRLARVEEDRSIQGYTDGVFWERNTLNQQRKRR
jgi:site-specific DNA-methyltransferase (adenine-specific)